MKVIISNPAAPLNVSTEKPTQIIHVEVGTQGPPGPKGEAGGIPDGPWTERTWLESPLHYYPSRERIPWAGSSQGVIKSTRIGRTVHAQLTMTYLTRRTDWDGTNAIVIPTTELIDEPQVSGTAFLIGTAYLSMADGQAEVFLMGVQVLAGLMVFLPEGPHTGGVSTFWGQDRPANLNNRRFSLTVSLTYEAAGP